MSGTKIEKELKLIKGARKVTRLLRVLATLPEENIREKEKGKLKDDPRLPVSEAAVVRAHSKKR